MIINSHLSHLVNFNSAVTTIVFISSIITVLVLVTHFRQWEALTLITLKIPWSTTSRDWSGNWMTNQFIRAIWTVRHSITCLAYRHTRSIHMAHEHTIATLSTMAITILFIFSLRAIIGSITHPR